MGLANVNVIFLTTQDTEEGHKIRLDPDVKSSYN